MTTLVELCAGTASVSLHALGGVGPLTGFMGSKRRWAPFLVDLLGVATPDRVLLVDGSPWGDVWTVLRNGAGPAVADQLIELDRLVDLDGTSAAWRVCLAPPDADPALRVARFLWLQARSASNIPIWWGVDHRDGVAKWLSPTGSRTEAAHEGRPGIALDGCRGMVHPRTLAARVLAVAELPWERVDVVHGDVRDMEPISGASVYFDPPYLKGPRYPLTFPRAHVLEVARRWAAAGCRVAVSEGEPLNLEGWRSVPLRTSRTRAGGGGRVRRSEWVTASWPIPVEPQLSLPGVAA